MKPPSEFEHFTQTVSVKPGLIFWAAWINPFGDEIVKCPEVYVSMHPIANILHTVNAPQKSLFIFEK